MTEFNPLLVEGDFPLFDQIRHDHVVPAVTQVLASNQASLDTLKQRSQEMITAKDLQEFEALEARLYDVWHPVEHLNAVMNSEPLREAYNTARAAITAYQTKLGQDEALYQLFKMLQQKADDIGLSSEQRKSVANSLLEFELSGVALAGESRDTYAQLKNEVSELTSQFSENVLDATDQWKKLIDDPQQLAGLPGSAMEMFSAAARADGQDGYLVTLDAPSYLAVMKGCENRELRKEVYEAYVTRASDQGPSAGTFDNSDIMNRIVEVRQAIAKLLGYEQFSEFSLATKMAETPEAVLAFLNELAELSLPVAEEEMQALKAFALADSGVSDLKAWDVAFYSERQRQAEFKLSEEALREYFPAGQVIQGMFDIVSKVFGVDVNPCPAMAIWHPDVLTYQVEQEGETVAFFYLDLYARAKKRGGAWMAECRNRRLTPDGRLQRPVAFLTCNFTPAVGDKPALLSHDEVVTLFHEFGHGLHHMLTKVTCAGVSGINGVEWDAVELPSQFLENWCWEREAIPMISAHIDSREPLPEVLLDRLLAAKNFQAGMQMVRQLEFSLFDFRLHHEAHKDLGIQGVLDAVRDQVAVVEAPPFNRFQHSFGHIFSSFIGYAAGYYSYKWAEVLSADAFSAFESTNPFDRQVGDRFVSSILERGGSEDAMSLFVGFMGREPQVDALLRQEGIAR